MLEYIPDHLKTQEMCIDAVIRDIYMLTYVPDHLKTQEMCKNAFEGGGSWMLKYVPDYFMTEDMIKNCDAYRNRKKLRKSISEELLPVAWHPDRYWDWCMPHDEKQEISKLWS